MTATTWWIVDRRLNALGRHVVTAADMKGRKVRVTLAARGANDTDERAQVALAFAQLYRPHTTRRIE